MSDPNLLDGLDELLDRLVISDELLRHGWRRQFYQRIAFERAQEILKWNDDIRDRAVLETRIRLALHLSPRIAIDYDRSNPRPRWKLIQSHLVQAFGRNAIEAERLSRSIALVLDNWDRERSPVTGHLTFLMARDGPACRNCLVHFGEESITLDRNDVYKPYYLSPDELLTPEVDHVNAVSAMGTNSVGNLQVLCRMCNAGKGDGLGLGIRDEVLYAGTSPENVPIAHRSRMVYYVINRDGRVCTQCDRRDTELTIRPVIGEGGLLRSNLRTLCVRCAYDIV